jgi:hypothetical protein
MSVGVARLASVRGFHACLQDTETAIGPSEGGSGASKPKVRKGSDPEEQQRKMMVRSLTSVPGIGYYTLTPRRV